MNKSISFFIGALHFLLIVFVFLFLGNLQRKTMVEAAVIKHNEVFYTNGSDIVLQMEVSEDPTGVGMIAKNKDGKTLYGTICFRWMKDIEGTITYGTWSPWQRYSNTLTLDLPLGGLEHGEKFSIQADFKDALNNPRITGDMEYLTSEDETILDTRTKASGKINITLNITVN